MDVVDALPDDPRAVGTGNALRTPGRGLTMSKFSIAAAARGDVPALHSMIRGLAEFEELTHLCVATEDDLTEALFGSRPAAEALLARAGDDPAGFALFFHNYSTFRGRPGLWLEDLYVKPEYRGRGAGQALLRALAAIAVERRCGRFEWAVLDWNVNAIRFYESLGGSVLPQWRIVRVEGAGIEKLADSAPRSE